MPPRFKPDANAIAKEGKNMALSDIIEEIEKAANDDPQGMPEGYQGIVKSLKDLNSGMAGSVSGAINSLDSIDDWFIQKGPNGKTNFEELEKRIGPDKLRELILLLNAKLGLDLEPDSLRRGLKKLKQLDDGSQPDVVDTGKSTYLGEEKAENYVEEKAKQPEPENKPEPVKNDLGEKGEYLPKEQREAHKAFSSALDKAAVGLTDKGLFGMRGSSKEHDELVKAYSELRGFSAHIVNEQDKKELALNNKLKALERTLKAADHYIAQKRRDGKADVYDDTFSPKSPMGVKRYEAAMKIREEARKELLRLDPEYEFESEIEKKQPEAEQQQPEIEQQQPEIEQEQPEVVAEVAEDKNIANILDDPDNLYDREGWMAKLDSFPDKMPENPELAAELANEMLKCTVAIGVIDQMNGQNVPEEERTAEKFLEMHDNGNSVIRDMGFLKLSPSAKWGFAAVAREVAYHDKEYVENLSKEELLERGIDKDQIENELKALQNDSPENEVEEAQPEAEEMKDDPEMINVDDMIKEMRDIDLDAIKDPKEASEKVLGTAAKILNTNLMIMTGQSLTTMGEFNKSTEKLRNSPEFKQVVLDNGGTGFGSLKGLQQKITKDCGKTLLGEFMQTSLHMKQREEGYQRVKDEYAKKKELELNRPQEEKVLGMNNN